MKMSAETHVRRKRLPLPRSPMVVNGNNGADEDIQRKTSDPSWSRKFGVAFRGLRVAAFTEKSFVVHFLMTGLAVAAGFVLGISAVEWCILILCVSLAISAELLNTGLERLAKAITREYHPEIRDALDIASAAVLVIAIGAVLLALLVLGDADELTVFRRSTRALSIEPVAELESLGNVFVSNVADVFAD